MNTAVQRVTAWVAAVMVAVSATGVGAAAEPVSGSAAPTLAATFDRMLAELFKGAAQGPGKVRVAVGNFPCRNSGNEGLSTLSRIVQDEFEAAVSRQSDRLELITRDRLAELIEEKKLGGLDILDPETPVTAVTVGTVEAILRGHYSYSYPRINLKAERVLLAGAKTVVVTETLPLTLVPTVAVLPDQSSADALTAKILPQNRSQTRTNLAAIEDICRTLANREIKAEIWVSNGRADFAEGERITFSVRTNVDCHVAVLCHQIDGKTVVLFPNRHNRATRIQGDRSVAIPGADKSRFAIVIRPPFGGDIVQVLACTRAAELRRLTREASPLGNSGYDGLEQVAVRRAMESIAAGDDAAVADGDMAAGADDVTAPGPTRWGEAHVVVNTYPR